MLKEKNPLLKINLNEDKYEISNILKNIYENLYSLFDVILDNPIENFWYECLGIIISHIQLLIYLFDKTVSK